MFEVTQELVFCYGHRLLRHPGKCARLHGHNGVARVTLRAGRLDAQGMVADFDSVSATLRAFVDETLDHRLILEEGDPAVAALRALGEPFCVVPFAPTAENLARLLFDRAARAGFPVVAVELVEMPGSAAIYAPRDEGRSPDAS